MSLYRNSFYERTDGVLSFKEGSVVWVEGMEDIKRINGHNNDVYDM